MIVTFLRFEYDDGSGIYRGNGSRDWYDLSNDDWDGELHPVPHEDELIMKEVIKRRHAGLTQEEIENDPYWENRDIFDLFLNWDHHFGFKDKEQATRWMFGGRLFRALHDSEVRIAEYDIEEEHLIVGDTQVIFDSKKVLRKEQHNILEYFGINNASF